MNFNLKNGEYNPYFNLNSPYLSLTAKAAILFLFIKINFKLIIRYLIDPMIQ
jgi:hypothetical protein